eukprot:SAG22_NODE_868_length_6763_cov_110.776261_1_plen_273_part_10
MGGALAQEQGAHAETVAAMQAMAEAARLQRETLAHNMMQRVLRQMDTSLASVVFAAWQWKSQTQKRVRHQTTRALHRVEHAAAARCFVPWLAAARAELQRRQEEAAARLVSKCEAIDAALAAERNAHATTSGAAVAAAGAAACRHTELEEVLDQQQASAKAAVAAHEAAAEAAAAELAETLAAHTQAQTELQTRWQQSELEQEGERNALSAQVQAVQGALTAEREAHTSTSQAAAAAAAAARTPAAAPTQATAEATTSRPLSRPLSPDGADAC